MNTPLLNAFRSAHHFLIAGHEHPDGDCITSQLALASLLNRLGKTTLLLSPGPFRRPELQPYKQLFTPTVPAPEDLPEPLRAPGRTCAVILDASAPERTGSLAGGLLRYPLLVIDHHATGRPFDAITHINPDSPSTTLLILQLMEALGEAPTRQEADLLFFGFCTDTGFFRHIHTTPFPVFPLVNRLIDAGATPRDTYYAINGGRTLASRKLLARLIERAEAHFEGKLIYTWETMADRADPAAADRDSDRLYELLLTIEGCEAVCTTREEKPGKFAVGLRSLRTVDVGKLAARFGGGGHARAAGCLVEKTNAALLKEKLLEAFGEHYADYPSGPAPSRSQ